MIRHSCRPPRAKFAPADPRSVMIEVSRIMSREWRVLRCLRLSALEEASDVLLGDYRSEATWTTEQWRNKCENEAWYSARVDLAPLGVARLAEPLNTLECVHIESMWVEPSHRNSGIARALLRRLEEDASLSGHAEIGLWVFERNHAARAFYMSAGYKGPVRRQHIRTSSSVVIEEEFRKGIDRIGPST